MVRDGEQTRRRILDAATDLFGREGFEKVTVKQIAEQLEITEPAVYRYFESKEALGSAVLDELVGRLDVDELFARLARLDDVEALMGGLASHIVAFFSDRQELYRLLLYSSLSGHTHAHAVYGALRGTYCSFLKRELDRLFKLKCIREVNNEVTARCFVGMVFDCALSNTLWKGMQGRLFPPAAIIANNVGIYARGLALRKEDHD